MEKAHIDKLAKKRIPYFIGTYDIDNVEPPKHLPAAYIINTLPTVSKKRVGHWVAMIIEKNEITILDSARKYIL